MSKFIIRYGDKYFACYKNKRRYFSKDKRKAYVYDDKYIAEYDANELLGEIVEIEENKDE